MCDGCKLGSRGEVHHGSSSSQPESENPQAIILTWLV